MGGEELAILMPVACAVDAVARAEESRRAAESLAIIHDGTRPPAWWPWTSLNFLKKSTSIETRLTSLFSRAAR